MCLNTLTNLRIIYEGFTCIVFQNTGKLLTIYIIIFAEDTCGSKNITCGDYGQCVNDDTETGYKCYCQPGHAGDNCQIGNYCTKNKVKFQKRYFKFHNNKITVFSNNII
jgi:hypothetical protein